MRLITILLMCLCINTYAYQMSEKGKELIKEFESLRLEAYQVQGESFKTIGYGHRIRKNENYTKISKKQAEKIFNNDINEINKSINRLLCDIPTKFSQGFVDGLGSLVFNCGECGVRNTDFYKTLLRCRIKKGVIDKYDLMYTVAKVKTTKVSYKGHIKRRYKEHLIMLAYEDDNQQIYSVKGLQGYQLFRSGFYSFVDV